MDTKKNQIHTEVPYKSGYKRKFIFVSIVTLSTIMIAIAYLILNEIIKAPTKAKMECYVSYLKSSSFADECFDSFGPFLGDPDKCDEIISKKIEDIEIATQKRLNEMAGHRAYTICILKTLKNDPDFANKVLLLEILEHTRLSWKFWMYFERNSRYKILENQLNFQESYAVSYCQGNTKNNDEFEGSGSSDVSDDTKNDDQRPKSDSHFSEYNNNNVDDDDDIYFEQD